MSASRGGLLDPRQAAWLATERQLLGDLHTLLARLDAPAEDRQVVRQALRDLDSLFLLVVVGEFNAGKSAVINALLGEAVLEEGVTPTTAAVTLLRHESDPADGLNGRAAGLRVVTHSAPLLRDLHLVDTPGTNAVLREHEALTREFVPRSDLVLFVTSADRPFSETERAFLADLRAWGKKIVIVLNKADLLATPEDLACVQAFIDEQAARLLDFRPQVFPVSARLARRAQQETEPAVQRVLWDASGFAAFQQYLVSTLDAPGRVRLKLQTPLGLGERVAASAAASLDQHAARIAADRAGVEQLEGQFEVYAEDLRRDFAPRLGEIEAIVYDLADRGDRFFEETVRLGRIFDLFNADKIRGAFEREVIADTARQLDAAVGDLIDWLVGRELKLWRAVTEDLQRRTAGRELPTVGTIGGPYEQHRAELLRSVGQTTRTVVERYDREAHAAQLSRELQTAVATTTLAEVGAVSLGTIIVLLVGSAAADVTGILAASVLAGLGFFILPARRRAAQTRFRQRTAVLRQQLRDALSRQFETELQRSLSRLREVVAPYTRFVRAEVGRIEDARAELSTLRAELDRLSREIAAETPTTSEAA